MERADVKVIGVLGGMSNQATAEYYRLINEAVNARLGGWNTAEVIINSVNFGNIERFVRTDAWAEAGQYLAGKVDRIIFNELVRRELRPESKAAYLDVIDKLRTRGAEGVILGCTEIFLLVSQEDRPDFPMFDTTALHVRHTVETAFGDVPAG